MKAHERLLEPERYLFDPRRSGRSHSAATRLLDVARCPLCRMPLLARMTRRGPAFRCACVRLACAKCR